MKTRYYLGCLFFIIVCISIISCSNEGNEKQGESDNLYHFRLSAGAGHTCVIKSDNSLWCWGSNDYWQLGNKNTKESNVPVLVDGLADEPVSVVAANGFTCTLLKNEEVYCWGANESGQLGDGSNQNRSVPTKVFGLEGVKMISARGNHACAITQDESVYCWGDNTYGQLGDGTRKNRNKPVLVKTGDYSTEMISAGSDFSCLLTGDSRIMCWGRAEYGATGLPPDADYLSPTEVTDMDTSVKLVSAGGLYTCAITEDGRVACWGNGDSTILFINGFSGKPVNISAGGYHACLLLDTGGVQCWGDNSEGQLGNGDNYYKSSSKPVDVNGIDSGAIFVSSGTAHSCVLLKDNRIKCWGANYYGQLGNGNNYHSTVPDEVVF